MDAETTIHSLLSFADREFASAQAFIKAEWECVQRLRELDAQQPGRIEAFAGDYLARLPAQEEGAELRFQCLLRALEEAHPQAALRLASDALLSPRTTDKSSYVSYLDSFETDAVVPVLTRFLESVRPSSDEFEPDASEAEAIDALTRLGAKEVAPQILARLTSPSEATRLAAAQYFRALVDWPATAKPDGPR
jgi:HEAT repeat protein